MSFAGRIKEAGVWYQPMKYGEIRPACHWDGSKIHPDSYGAGRWSNYIKPLLGSIRSEIDAKDTAFCELGCNAGLFLLLANRELDFSRLIGIEPAKMAFSQLLITSEYYNALPLEMYHAGVGELEPNIRKTDASALDLATLPMAEVTLLSCVHYHLNSRALHSYLHALSRKSRYLLIVTDENARDTMPGSSVHLQSIIDTDEWEKCGTVRTQNRPPDRKNLTSHLYISRKLTRLKVDDCMEKQLDESEANGDFYRNVFPRFISGVLAGSILRRNCSRTEVYRWQVEGRKSSTAWPAEVALARTLSYYDMVLSMREHGQEQPIMLYSNDKWDGCHRVAVAHYLAHKYIYGAPA